LTRSFSSGVRTRDIGAPLWLGLFERSSSNRRQASREKKARTEPQSHGGHGFVDGASEDLGVGDVVNIASEQTASEQTAPRPLTPPNPARKGRGESTMM
jgi:hypothetical protein